MERLDYRKIGKGKIMIKIATRGGEKCLFFKTDFTEDYASCDIEELEQLVIDLISIRNEFNREEVKSYDGDE